MEWEDVKELAVILLEVMIAVGAMILFPSAASPFIFRADR